MAQEYSSDACPWCMGKKPKGATFCSRKCRQAAFRLRRRMASPRGRTDACGAARADAQLALLDVDRDASGEDLGDALLPRGLDDALGPSMADAAGLHLEAATPSLPAPNDGSCFATTIVVEKSDTAGYLPDAPLPARQYSGDGCAWCGKARRPGAIYCSGRCRHIAWRRACRNRTLERWAAPMRWAYADPPYPGCAHMYADQPEHEGEIDFEALLRQLRTTYEHFALSTSARSLQRILPMLPREHRICPWIKPGHPHPKTYGLHNLWEPLIVVGGRQRRPGKRDWLLAAPAHLGGSTLVGRKPLAFWAFLFQAIGTQAGDTFDDLFPGSGMGTAAFREMCRSSTGDRRFAELEATPE
jgi:predicted nucleic acid-binding Zn ribbon protein